MMGMLGLKGEYGGGEIAVEGSHIGWWRESVLREREKEKRERRDKGRKTGEQMIRGEWRLRRK